MKIIALFVLLFCMTAIPQEKLRVLVITGGHDFERQDFFDMFADFADIDFQSIEQPRANSVYNTAKIKEYDALVFYDMTHTITEEQKAAFVFMAKQGTGLVFLHHSLASYQDWDEFKEIIGGRYNEPHRLSENDKHKASTYKHDVTMNVHIVDPEHPVTEKIQDFELYDEVYGNFEVMDTVQPLLKTDHPESGKVIGWAHTYGKSRVVYLQPGHDHHAYQDPNYRLLVNRAIRWVSETCSGKP